MQKEAVVMALCKVTKQQHKPLRLCYCYSCVGINKQFI